MTLMIKALHTPVQSSKRYYNTICNTEHPCKVPLTFCTALPCYTGWYVVNNTPCIYTPHKIHK